MQLIKFYNFNISDGEICLSYKDGEKNGNLIFELTPKIKVHNDLICIALSTLCGRGKYIQIEFDIPISNYAKKEIEEFCQASVILPESNELYDEIKSINLSNRENIALNFSGGFDSLAAKYLMPKNTILTSMDFGGRFAREGVFFRKFNTNIVKTNLLDTHLRYNSWSFMGISSILFSEYYNIKYITFGGILEASINNISNNPVAMKNITFPPLKAAGLINAPYTLGITEIGTAMTILHHSPELVEMSLDSLANPGESKKYRKQLITHIVSNKMNIGIKINKFDEPNHKLSFGKNFADDFLLFYFVKNLEKGLTLRLFDSIPDEIYELSEKSSFTFYERLNPNFLVNFPQELRGELLKNTSDVGIIPYTKQDWTELNEVLSILSKYHSIN